MAEISPRHALRKALRRIDYYGATKHADKVAVVRRKLKDYGYNLPADQVAALIKAEGYE